jgi:hypothetical protein
MHKLQDTHTACACLSLDTRTAKCVVLSCMGAVLARYTLCRDMPHF